MGLILTLLLWGGLLIGMVGLWWLLVRLVFLYRARRRRMRGQPRDQEPSRRSLRSPGLITLTGILLLGIGDALARTPDRNRPVEAARENHSRQTAYELALLSSLVYKNEAEDVIIVASTAMLNPFAVAGFNNLGTLNRDDDLSASRPFDSARNGFVMGEGAAAMWLSSRSHPRAPGYLSGYGQSMNATHMTGVPDDIGVMLRACSSALAGMPDMKQDLAYISAHGTSTRLNDAAEIRVYRELLGEGRGSVPISSLKSMIGHCLGASSLIEACVCLDVLAHGTAPPTINLEHPEPESDLDFVPNESREVSGDFVLSNAFGFGGHNSSLLFSREPV